MLTRLQSLNRLFECAAPDPDLARKGRLLGGLLLAFVGLELINIIYSASSGLLSVDPIDVIVLLGFIGLYVANRRGWVAPTAWTVIALAVVLITYVAVSLPAERLVTGASTPALFVVPVTMSGVFLSWRAAALVTVACAAITIWFYSGGATQYATYFTAHPDERSLLLFTVGLSFVSAGLLAGTSGRLIESALDDLRQRNRELEAANKAIAAQERLRSELDIARSIQRRLLPAQVPQLAALEIAAECRPALETSGDSYDLLVGDDGALHVVVLDACGKSVPAALLTALSRNPLRAALARTGDPAEALTETNRLLTPDLVRHQFVAACCLSVTAGAETMVVANAGQVYPLLARRNGVGVTGTFVETPHPRLPLGIATDTDYSEARVPLQSGDVIVCCSDGVVDAIHHSGEPFGFDNLSDLVCRSVAEEASAGDILRTVLTTLQNWADSAAPQDDITVIVLRVR